MTTIFPAINNEIYIIKSLTDNITTRSYKIDIDIDTEKLETWWKVTFACAPGSTNFAFIKNLIKNSPPKKIVSMYQTIWIIKILLN